MKYIFTFILYFTLLPFTLRACPQLSHRIVERPEHAIVGEKKGLIILVEFQDRKFIVPQPATLFHDIANVKGYDKGRYRGSVRDYFNAQSNGKLDLTFDVVGPVTMPQKLQYYGSNTITRDAKVGEMIVSACQMVDESVNFADYDWNNDGEAELVFVVYAGYGENVSSDQNTIWPKQSTLEKTLYGKSITVDGTVVNTFACSCELNGSSGNEATGIGAICHEFSHCFGLADLYDKYGLTFGMGTWDLMDTGMYNDNGFCPAGYTAFEKWYSGWMELTELDSPQEITGMRPLSEGGEAFIIYNDAHRDEYYILENRQKTGWDACLEGNGLLVTHIDYDKNEWRYNSVNSDETHPRYIAVPADNRRDDETCAGDAYPFGGNDRLTDDSTPAAKLYNANTDGRKFLGKPITDIRQNPDGTVSFRFMNPPASITSVTVSDSDRVDVYAIDGTLLLKDCTTDEIPMSGKGLRIVRPVNGGSPWKTIVH